jgi:predicted TIM-barrel fold metal-dependent hydrolase
VGDTYISADSHVLEPGDLWTQRVPASFRDRAPQIVTRDGASMFVGEGLNPQNVSVGMSFAAGQRGEVFTNTPEDWQSRPLAGYEPAARIEAMDIDGVAGEVLYPTLGRRIYACGDPALRRVAMEAYNEWLAEFCTATNGRAIGVGLVALDDPTTAEDQLGRLLDLGLRGAMLPTRPDMPYNDPGYEPLWAAAAAAAVPLSLHAGSGGASLVQHRGPGAGGINYIQISLDMQFCCQSMIWSGVFERHPELFVIFVEIGIGWIAPLITRMDDVWEQHRGWMKPVLGMAPSEYFSRNCGATFERDYPGIRTLEWCGDARLMWATDYPHAESNWPNSIPDAVANLKELSPDARARIISGAVRELYRWDPAA